MGELADGGHIAPAPERDFYLPNKALTLTEEDAGFELLGSELAIYDDFVFGARIAIVTEDGASVGCGIFYRWNDASNLDLAFVDTGGGFGVVQLVAAVPVRACQY